MDHPSMAGRFAARAHEQAEKEKTEHALKVRCRACAVDYLPPPRPENATARDKRRRLLKKKCEHAEEERAVAALCVSIKYVPPPGNETGEHRTARLTKLRRAIASHPAVAPPLSAALPTAASLPAGAPLPQVPPPSPVPSPPVAVPQAAAPLPSPAPPLVGHQLLRLLQAAASPPTVADAQSDAPAVPWLNANGTRGSRAALWGWLRASGVNAPRAVLCAVGESATERVVAAAVRALGPPPLVLRLQVDRRDASIGARSFLVASPGDVAPVAAFAQLLQQLEPGGDIVIWDDVANGKIGLLLDRCEPIVVQVAATRKSSTATNVQLLLGAPDRADQDDDAGSDAVAEAIADGTSPRGGGNRTRSLAELEWQLRKVYASREPGPGGVFAPDEAWCKARWGSMDGQKVLRRAELAAWLANAVVPSRLAVGGGGTYEVHLAFGFRPADSMPGQIGAASDLRELVVVDLQLLPPTPPPPSAGEIGMRGDGREAE